MYYPSLTEVKNMGHLGNLVPIYREINADLETPVSAYLKVARPPYSFLLESVEGGEHLARYSFIGTEPDHLIETGPGRKDGEVDPLGILEDILSEYKVVKSGYLPRFMGAQLVICPMRWSDILRIFHIRTVTYLMFPNQFL